MTIVISDLFAYAIMAVVALSLLKIIIQMVSIHRINKKLKG